VNVGGGGKRSSYNEKKFQDPDQGGKVSDGARHHKKLGKEIDVFAKLEGTGRAWFESENQDSGKRCLADRHALLMG